MSGSRYQIREEADRRGGVTTYRGVDPLTGLPVLIYRFPERPAAGADGFESENAPGLLEIGWDGREGRVVVAISSGYEAAPAGPFDDAFLVEAARALRDAAEAGLVHGDLRPERFLAADGHVLIEGYGAPWRPEEPARRAPGLAPSERGGFAADVWMWAAALRDLGGARSEGARALLERCLADAPDARPEAAQILAELEGLASRRGGGEAAVGAPGSDGGPGGREAPPPPPPAPAGPAGATSIDLELDFGWDGDDEGSPEAPRPDGDRSVARIDDLEDLDLDSPEPDRATRPGAPAADDPDAPLIRPAGPRRPPPGPADPSPADPDPLDATDPGDAVVPAAFVKDLPPGARYRAGRNEDRPSPAAIRRDRDEAPAAGRQDRRWRRRAAGLLALAAAVALLVWLVPRDRLSPSDAPAGSSAVYVLDVRTSPAGLPPVTLTVVESPPGATLRPGAEIGTVPSSGRRITLRDTGTWAFQGVLQERASEPVRVTVPEQLTVVLEIPPPPEEADGTEER